MNPSAPFPLPLVLAVLLLALLFRVIDIFVLRLDERWGEILLSKTLALALVLAAVVVAGRDLQAIGLRHAGAGRIVLVSILAMLVIFGVALALQILALRLQGVGPALSFEAIDPKTGLRGGLEFALVLTVGNAINAVAEEALFRGLMLPTFEASFGLWQAVVLQAVLFGAWHLVWPARAVFLGEATAPASIGPGLALLLGASVAGIAFGLLYHVTGSLWVPIAVHFLNNSFYNFVHLRTSTGLDKDVLLMQFIVTVGLVALVPLVRVAAR